MKEITLKEWSAYLPYGLKGELQFDKSENFELQDWAIDLSKFKKGAIWKLCGYADTDLHIPLGDGEFYGWLWRNEYTYVNFHSGIKPILYDLSWLTREITHEGETFIPLYKLQKIDKAFVLTFIETFGYEELKVEVFELLLEWRFNVFSLPDELIVRVTEDFNPYK